MSDLDPLYFQATDWTLDILTILLSSIFLYSFFQLREKNYSMYLILVLCIVDFLYPVLNIIGMLTSPEKPWANIIVGLEYGMFELGLCLSAALAVLVSLVLTQKICVDPLKYTIYAFLSCIIVPIVMTVLITTEQIGITVETHGGKQLDFTYPVSDVGDAIVYFMIFNFVGRVLPVSLTFYSYFKVFKQLMKMSQTVKLQAHTTPSRVLCYSLIQIICFFPGVFNTIYFMCHGPHYPAVISLIIYILYRAWGFLNLLAYWFLRPQEQNKNDLNEMSLTISDV